MVSTSLFKPNFLFRICLLLTFFFSGFIRRCFCLELMALISSRVFMGVAVIFVLVFAIVSPYVEAQSASPAPSPTSDGTSIDQGIAYVLMLAALVLTYLIHPPDASSYGFF